jgi:hypothetical protein
MYSDPQCLARSYDRLGHLDMAAKKKAPQAATPIDVTEMPMSSVVEDRVEAAARTLPRRRFFDDVPDNRRRSDGIYVRCDNSG